MVRKKKISPVLMWIFFIVGIGELLASGIYIEIASHEFPRGIIRAFAFGFLGVYFMFMYGECRRRIGVPDPSSKQET
jgi:hypothetical protein